MDMKKLLFVPLVGLLCACGDVEEYEQPAVANEKVESFTLNASYEGKEYSVPCLLVEDKDSIIFLDKEFEDLFYNEISKQPNMVCEVKSDGSVEYKNEVIEDTISTVPVQSRLSDLTGTTGDTYLQFYSDKDYKGKSQRITLTFKYSHWEIASLEPIKWANTISSIKVRHNDSNIKPPVVLLAYDQKLFKGHVLKYEFYVSYLPEYHLLKLNIPNLKKTPMDGGGTWNDKIVSMKFYYR